EACDEVGANKGRLTGSFFFSHTPTSIAAARFAWRHCNHAPRRRICRGDEQTTKTARRRAAFGARDHSAGTSGTRRTTNARLYAAHLYREAMAARPYSGDIDNRRDHRPPIGCDVGGPVRRVPILLAAGGDGRYRRDRCRAIAVLFSWASELMPATAQLFSSPSSPRTRHALLGVRIPDLPKVL